MLIVWGVFGLVAADKLCLIDRSGHRFIVIPPPPITHEQTSSNSNGIRKFLDLVLTSQCPRCTNWQLPRPPVVVNDIRRQLKWSSYGFARFEFIWETDTTARTAVAVAAHLCAHCNSIKKTCWPGRPADDRRQWRKIWIEISINGSVCRSAVALVGGG